MSDKDTFVSFSDTFCKTMEQKIQPNIGRRIKNVLKLRGMSAETLAELLEMKRRGTYRILKKRHLNTELLMKISAILKHDFFQYFQPDPNLPGRHKLEKEKLQERLRQLEKENKLLRKVGGE